MDTKIKLEILDKLSSIRPFFKNKTPVIETKKEVDMVKRGGVWYPL